MKQKIAVGGSLRPSSRSAATAPDSIEKSPFIDDEVAFGAGLLRTRRGAAQAIAAERTDQRAGDDADAAVAEPIEMVHRIGRRGGVVDVHAGDAEARVNSQPLTTGARPGGIARTSAAASFGSRWPRKISPSASLRLSISA